MLAEACKLLGCGACLILHSKYYVLIVQVPNSSSTSAVPFHGPSNQMSSVHGPQPMIGPSLQNPGIPPSYSPHQTGLNQDQYNQHTHKEAGMANWEKQQGVDLNSERSMLQYPYTNFAQHDSGAMVGSAPYSYKNGGKDVHTAGHSLVQQEQAGLFASGSVGQDHQQYQGK